MDDQASLRHQRVDTAFLVVRLQAGDEAAFGQLYRTYGPKTMAYLRGLVGDEAEDVQQELWLGVFRGIRGLLEPGAFRTWLFRSTRHRAIDLLRRQRRAELLESRFEEEGEEVRGPPELDDSGYAPEDLDRALKDLPALQREVFLLRYRDELEYQEIAEVVGCAVGTVRSRLYHARRALAEWFRRTGGPSRPPQLQGGNG